MLENDAIKISDSIFWVGAQDRETDLFEALWKLPYGVAYNAYLLAGDASVLVDTVKGHFMDGFLERLSSVLSGKPLDYVIVNHMEPDHAGSLGILRKMYPGVKIIGNAKTAEMLKNFFNIEDNVVTVKDGEILDIGSRKFLFAFVPMVHWPESMVAYDVTDKILFSSDIFGGFGATEGGIFDDQADMELVTSEMMRYYVNIVGRFAEPALKALAKVKPLDITAICPAHGPIWRSDPKRVIGLYEKLSRQETEEGVVVVYGSMYGNTKAIAEKIARVVSGDGVKRVAVYDIARCDMSIAATDIWRNAGLILASCTYNMELFPPMAKLLRHLENKNMKGRHVGLCGTYSWAGTSLREMSDFVERSKGNWTLVEPKIPIKTCPKGEEFDKIELLAHNMARAVKRS
jgi:flavorubredoxin